VGWLGLAIGVVSLTPAGPVGLVGLGVWIVILSVLMVRPPV